MMKTRTNGLARSKEPKPTIWNNKASPQMTQTVQNHKSCITGGISTRATPSMEYPPHVPCEPTYPIHPNRCTQPQLLPTATRSNKRRSGIQSESHQEPLTLWEEQKLQYLLKWKGYPESDNTWEPIKQLHAPNLV
jgi:hypothetical protein